MAPCSSPRHARVTGVTGQLIHWPPWKAGVQPRRVTEGDTGRGFVPSKQRTPETGRGVVWGQTPVSPEGQADTEDSIPGTQTEMGRAAPSDGQGRAHPCAGEGTPGLGACRGGFKDTRQLTPPPGCPGTGFPTSRVRAWHSSRRNASWGPGRQHWMHVTTRCDMAPAAQHGELWRGGGENVKNSVSATVVTTEREATPSASDAVEQAGRGWRLRTSPLEPERVSLWGRGACYR